VDSHDAKRTICNQYKEFQATNVFVITTLQKAVIQQVGENPPDKHAQERYRPEREQKRISAAV